VGDKSGAERRSSGVVGERDKAAGCHPRPRWFMMIMMMLTWSREGSPA
jgi:hypothetical protein